MTIGAIDAFRRAFHGLGKETGLSDTELSGYRTKLEQFYRNSFGAELSRQSGEQANIGTLLPDEAPVIISQYNYIADNPNPLGNKHQLDAAPGASRYSEIHNKYHHVFRDYLERFGYYDIFLVDPETGEKMVANVYRRDDIYTGPHRELGPDIVLEPKWGYDFKGAVNKEELTGRTALCGMHTYEDAHLYVRGRELGMPGSGPEGLPAIQDVVPTMLAMMGLPVPDEMTGKVLF